MKAKNVLDKLKDLKLRRWGPAEYTEAKNSNEGGGEPGEIGSDVFFVPATTQPKYFISGNDTEPIDIKNYTPIDIKNYRDDNRSNLFLYNKEDIISLGINEEDLNNLNIVGINDAYNDVYEEHPTGLLIPKNSFDNKIVFIDMDRNHIGLYGSFESYVYKISDNIFIILERQVA